MKRLVLKDSYEVKINPEAPIYVISVVSTIVHIPIWTLRKLDDLGVICPMRIGKKTRCYSHVQVQKLSYVKHLMEVRGVNISGIKVILEMEGAEGKK